MSDTGQSRPIRKTIATKDPDLEIVVTDDASRTLRVKSTETTWHSESGALSESTTVFLKNGNVESLLNSSKMTSILEIGFGTGLNFWITASLAIHNNARLDYVSIEPRILNEELIANLNHHELPSCQPAMGIFAGKIFQEKTSQIHERGIQLRIAKSIDALSYHERSFDCVYHDPFAPSIAPDLWSSEYFQRLYQLLIPSGRLVTYCVKSKIQKILKQIGFLVSKTPGPVGGKREVLIAEKP